MSDLINIIQVGLFVLTKIIDPCLIEFYEGESISGHMNTYIIRNLDDLKLYKNDKEDGIISVPLVDGHGSFFIWFKICMYNENHKWTVFSMFLTENHCGKMETQQY